MFFLSRECVVLVFFGGGRSEWKTNDCHFSHSKDFLVCSVDPVYPSNLLSLLWCPSMLFHRGGYLQNYDLLAGWPDYWLDLARNAPILSSRSDHSTLAELECIFWLIEVMTQKTYLQCKRFATSPRSTRICFQFWQNWNVYSGWSGQWTRICIPVLPEFNAYSGWLGQWHKVLVLQSTRICIQL